MSLNENINEMKITLLCIQITGHKYRIKKKVKSLTEFYIKVMLPHLKIK